MKSKTMRLNSIAANQTELEIGDAIIMFSYSTPVAAFVPGRGGLVTDRHFSVTTSRHINLAIKRWGCSRTVVPQAEIEGLLYSSEYA